MIRPLTFLCMLAAVGSGLYLYTEKHSAELLDRQITKTVHATEAARERTGLLRAEWALLNEPGRLQAMADQYLALKPMAPTQFVQMADLGSRLPAPVAQSAQQASPTDDDSSAPDALPTPSPADPGINPAPVADAKPAPEAVAAKQAKKPAAPAHTTAKLVAHASPHKPAHPVAVASGDGIGRDNPLAHSAPLPLATPQPAGARVMSAMARPVHTHLGGWSGARPAVMTATPTALGSGAYIGSALAGRGSLPPPVPMGAQ
jgi:hypothetical protein